MDRRPAGQHSGFIQQQKFRRWRQSSREDAFLDRSRGTSDRSSDSSSTTAMSRRSWLATSSVCSAVNGHWEAPGGGHELCPLVAIGSAQGWPPDVPGWLVQRDHSLSGGGLEIHPLRERWHVRASTNETTSTRARSTRKRSDQRLATLRLSQLAAPATGGIRQAA